MDGTFTSKVLVHVVANVLNLSLYMYMYMYIYMHM